MVARPQVTPSQNLLKLEGSPTLQDFQPLFATWQQKTSLIENTFLETHRGD